MHLSSKTIAEITGGHWLAPVAREISAIVDDSRIVAAGSLFMAIRGTITDGHRHLESAVSNGAAAVCVDCLPDPDVYAAAQKSGAGILLVSDTLTAFHALALAHRRRFGEVCMLAVTGSSGKTSTKEMVAAVLEARWGGGVLKTEGNTNNHFGVPRNLLRLHSGHKAAVIELGTSAPGEILSLTALVEPDIAIVCNIGPAHLEALGDMYGVAREKGALLAGLKLGGTAILQAATPYTQMLTARCDSRRIITFGWCDSGADMQVRYNGYAAGRYHAEFKWRDDNTVHFLEWDVGGEHQALNAAAAAAAAMACGLGLETTTRALANCRIPGMRMAVMSGADGVNWVNDAYNANPASTRAGILWFKERTRDCDGRKILVLGDMLELGACSAAEHTSLIEWARDLFPGALIFAVGPLMQQVVCDTALATFADSAAAGAFLAGYLRAGDWVYLKASRGVRLEKIMVPADEAEMTYS